MPTYVYRCGVGCPDFVERHPMASIPDRRVCPECGDDARRVIGAPSLGVGGSAEMRLQDATRASAETPAVVSGVPRSGRRATPISRNPLHRKLPRP
ncbi:zinc ribbon domain-containing protein [Gordonia sp. Z-3]|uniref:FmdB family zinc ribbon protein n=1 Tax=Gordonia sp. Z-3 TaxID=3115408 RepID=UPI002E28B768|nr:zinc ribbon domain-containing protein [Gordonia sp. Z-3]MED5803385.1 zinc ribbon domain-containing protein [Gordonia sp. Z-3]